MGDQMGGPVIGIEVGPQGVCDKASSGQFPRGHFHESGSARSGVVAKQLAKRCLRIASRYTASTNEEIEIAVAVEVCCAYRTSTDADSGEGAGRSLGERALGIIEIEAIAQDWGVRLAFHSAAYNI